MVVRLSVGIVRSVVEVECDIEEVDDLEVSLDCDVQSVSFKMSRDVLLILSELVCLSASCGFKISSATALPGHGKKRKNLMLK